MTHFELSKSQDANPTRSARVHWILDPGRVLHPGHRDTFEREEVSGFLFGKFGTTMHIFVDVAYFPLLFSLPLPLCFLRELDVESLKKLVAYMFGAGSAGLYVRKDVFLTFTYLFSFAPLFIEVLRYIYLLIDTCNLESNLFSVNFDPSMIVHDSVTVVLHVLGVPHLFCFSDVLFLSHFLFSHLSLTN